MKHLAASVLLFLSSAAIAGPPSGYQCVPGTAKVGIGCDCPATHISGQDGEGIAICRAKQVAPPVVREPAVVPVVRTPMVTFTVTITDRFKPAPVKPIPPLTPEIDAEAVLSIEGLVGNIRTEQESILVELIRNTPDAEVEAKSDYYFRLGELYAKQARFFRLKAAEQALARDATNDAAAKTKANSDALAATSKAKDYLIKAVKTYKDLTGNEKFRNYPKMDIALFYYAYTMQRGGYAKEARSVYDQLVKNYPNSKYVPEAHLAFADYYFEANQPGDAEARYKLVLKFPKSPMFQYAKYKLAWLNLQAKNPQALDLFSEVVGGTKGDPKQDVVHRAAKTGFLRAYVEIGKPEKAATVLPRVDRAATRELVDTLAALYADQGKHDKASLVYASLVAAYPGEADVCAWQSASVRAAIAGSTSKSLTVTVCTAAADAFKQWGQTAGVDVK